MRRPDRKGMAKAFVAGVLAVSVTAPLATTWAQTPEQRGLEISEEADRRDTGFGDSASIMIMVLRNRHGQETSRQMRSRILERLDDGDMSVIIFDDPADVKGTAFLTHTHKSPPDDQWLYLPALKRVKRIASRNKSGPFMGSEFAYEDLASQEVEKYTYRYLGDETFDDRDHFMIERVPVDERSGYTRQVTWIDKDQYRVFKVEFYDRKESLLKTLTMHDYHQYLDKYWRADRMDMVNHQTGKSTTLSWTDYRFGSGYEESDFTRNSLAKAR